MGGRAPARAKRAGLGPGSLMPASRSSISRVGIMIWSANCPALMVMAQSRLRRRPLGKRSNASRTCTASSHSSASSCGRAARVRSSISTCGRISLHDFGFMTPPATAPAPGRLRRAHTGSIPARVRAACEFGHTSQFPGNFFAATAHLCRSRIDGMTKRLREDNAVTAWLL